MTPMVRGKNGMAGMICFLSFAFQTTTGISNVKPGAASENTRKGGDDHVSAMPLLITICVSQLIPIIGQITINYRPQLGDFRGLGTTVHAHLN